MLALTMPIQIAIGDERGEPPSMELLEFLADSEQVKDEWVDPVLLNNWFAESTSTGYAEKLDNGDGK